MRLCRIPLFIIGYICFLEMRHPGVEPGSPRVCVFILSSKEGRAVGKLGFLRLATRYSTDKPAAHVNNNI